MFLYCVAQFDRYTAGCRRTRSLVVAMAACITCAATAQAQAILDLDLSIDQLTPTSAYGVGIDLDLAGTEIGVGASDGDVTIDVSLPEGYVLRDVSCPGDVQVDVRGSIVNLSPSDGADIGSCVLQIVNVVTASAAAIPAVLQRNDLLLNVELGLNQQLDRFGSADSSTGRFPRPYGLGAARALAREQSGAPPTPSGGINVWAEGYLAHVETDNGTGSSGGQAGVLFAGADYLLSPHLLIGLLAQYDEQQRSFHGAGLRFEDQGWLIGPYAVVRLSDQTFLQVRAGLGRTQNDLQLNGVFDDRFDSDRWLVKGRLLTNLTSGNWLVRPSVSIAYVQDDLEAYQSSAGFAVEGRTLSLGQMKFGPEIAYRYVSGDYVITPSLTLEGIWNFDRNGSGQGFDDLVDTAVVRGRVEAGTTIQSARGTSFGLAATYDGIGISEYSALGGRARLTIPLD